MRKNKQRFNLVMSIFFIGVVGYMIWGIRDRKESLNDTKVKYSIGKILDFEVGSRVAPWFTYTFYDGAGILREGRYSINDSLRRKSGNFLRSYIGKEFFVKYSVKKPKYNELYLYQPVPDSLLDCTDCVWDKPPF